MDQPVLMSAVGLSKRFSLAAEVVVALEDLTFDIREGEFLAVTGPSGSGKTTLLNLLGGLDRPTGGSLRWRGQPFDKLPERDLARIRCNDLGFVFQDACLMSGLDALGNTCLPQLLSGSSNVADRARKLLERFGLGSKLKRLPRQLSRGEKQRVAIARALANEPAILLADEPTGNLDQSATAQTFATFKELNQKDGLTVVVATHDKSIFQYVTRSMVLSDGHLARETNQ
jgi:ABC-type lipoprotein export system ATPase subunit